jgi:hypothetical protein
VFTRDKFSDLWYFGIVKDKYAKITLITFAGIFILAGFIVTYKDSEPQNQGKELPSETKTKTYSNDKYGFSFNYPENQTLNVCSSQDCLSINESTVRVTLLSNSYFAKSYFADDLQNDNLNCDADGVQGSISCDSKTQVVEKLKSGNSHDVYRISRLKRFEGEGFGIARGEYTDYAYVFMLPKKIDKEQAVLFSVDIPTEQNLKNLDFVINSFAFTN